METVGRTVGFTVMGSLSLAILAGVVLLPPYARLAEARYRRDCLQARIADQETLIAVNDKLETNVGGVYAIGDAVGTTYLAHGAFAEAEVAAANATGGDERIDDYSLVPRAVYTFPEIASVGKNEEKCDSEGLDVSVGKSFFNKRCSEGI